MERVPTVRRLDRGLDPVRLSQKLERDRDAIIEFRGLFEQYGGDPANAELRARVNRAAGAAAPIAEHNGVVLQIKPPGQLSPVPTISLNPFLAWPRAFDLRDVYHFPPDQLYGVADSLIGRLDAGASKAREDEKGLVGLIARFVRLPLDVRERAGFPAQSAAGRAAVGVGVLVQGIVIATIGGVITALALRI